jgi:hypothetical protein
VTDEAAGIRRNDNKTCDLVDTFHTHGTPVVR